MDFGVMTTDKMLVVLEDTDEREEGLQISGDDSTCQIGTFVLVIRCFLL
jgi:hypothetical protein